jgi:hypothetical protein
MKISQKRLLLTTLRNVLILLAVITVLPRPASDPDLLGYHTVCAFVPVSTIFLIGLAGITQLFHNSIPDEARGRCAGMAVRKEDSGPQIGNRNSRKRGSP